MILDFFYKDGKHGFTSIILKFSLTMLGSVILLAAVFFIILYNALNDTENRIAKYSTINELSMQVQNSMDDFEQCFSYVREKEFSFASISENRASYFRYRALLTLRKLKCSYDDNKDLYFLNNAMVSGLLYLNSKMEEKSNLSLQTEDDYKEYYHLLSVYQYLMKYINGQYLAAFVKSESTASYYNMQNLKTLKKTALISLPLAILACIIISIIITKSLSRHVTGMVKFTDAVASSNFSVEDMVLSGPREFYILKDRINNMKHALEERLELEKELERARYLSLQAQINPHFLFNTLNIISHTALFEKATSTQNLINLLAAMFRYRLDFKESVKIEEEIDFVNQYLKLQKSRFASRIDFDITMEPEVKGFIIPPLVIQPIVENAVIHGIEKSEIGGYILINAKKIEEEIVISIENSGAPYKEGEENCNRKHIGIKNVESRLALFYNDKARIAIIKGDGENNTIVTLHLPC